MDRATIPRILESIEKLSENPFPAGFKKLQGSEKTFRMRVGNYRIIYQLDNSDVITVIHIRHRKDAYK